MLSDLLPHIHTIGVPHGRFERHCRRLVGEVGGKLERRREESSLVQCVWDVPSEVRKERNKKEVNNKGDRFYNQIIIIIIPPWEFE